MFYAISIVIVMWKNIIYIIKYENHQKTQFTIIIKLKHKIKRSWK